MPLLNPHQLNVLDRLETLSRSPDQSDIVRYLVLAGFAMQTLDTARVEKLDSDDTGKFAYDEDYLLFRDRNSKRWSISRNGTIRAVGRSTWKITSPEVRT